jgi:hypothetical protein
MSTLKECKVIMLPTEDKGPVWIYTSGTRKPQNSNYVSQLGCGDQYQHLYIVSDDEIKEGDYLIDDNGIFGPWEYGNTIVGESKGRIIATTDKSLTIEKSAVGYTDGGRARTFYGKELLPEPSKEFIQKYCELGGINKIMVQYDSKIRCYKCGKTEADCIATSSNCVGYYEETYQLKVSKDNTITIKPVKDSWNREEVEELCRRAWILGLNKPPYQEIYNAWKESNL